MITNLPYTLRWVCLVRPSGARSLSHHCRQRKVMHESMYSCLSEVFNQSFRKYSSCDSIADLGHRALRQSTGNFLTSSDNGRHNTRWSAQLELLQHNSPSQGQCPKPDSQTGRTLWNLFAIYVTLVYPDQHNPKNEAWGRSLLSRAPSAELNFRFLLITVAEEIR